MMLKIFFETIKFKEAQQANGLTIIPVVHKENICQELDFITLFEALDSGVIEITEVSDSGRVPELKVINKGYKQILLIDGEELKGAKQNRILNATILVPARSELTIPVSCTESGRWRRESDHFRASDFYLGFTARKQKNLDIQFNLSMDYGFKADQSKVWSEIECLHDISGSSKYSTTRAMEDAYRFRNDKLKSTFKQFAMVPGQIGMIVIQGDKVLGGDFILRPLAFELMFEKIVKSYLIENTHSKSEIRENVNYQKAVNEFLQNCYNTEENKYKSTGDGDDLRYSSDKVIGSIIVYNDEVYHASFLNKE